MRNICSFLALISLIVFEINAKDVFHMHSPNRHLLSQIKLSEKAVQYNLYTPVDELLSWSQLGINANGILYGQETDLITLVKSWTNEESENDEMYNGYLFEIKRDNSPLYIEFRLFNQGMGFRYILEGAKSFHVKKELTKFSFLKNPAWYFERDNAWKLRTYAGLWLQSTTALLDTQSKQGPIQGKPLLVERSNGGYILLTEAALYNYSGMRLKGIGNSVFEVNFTENEGFTITTDKLESPWRVAMVSDNLTQLVNNNIIHCLNPKPNPQLYPDPSYIKPGRTVWSWITRDENYLDINQEKAFIDAASELTFEYTLIDDGWETKWAQKWETLSELTTYGAHKNVGVWVWKDSHQLRDPSVRDAFLDSLVSCKVVGIKTDFMNSEAKELIDFEIDLLVAAAKRKLMVNFHGCHPPTGESKTYPNEMTREGIRGMELNIMNEPIPAWHNAALPFTRLVLGDGDYTPGLFYNRANTTVAHQLALLYLFNSSLQCFAENPIKILQDSQFKCIIPLLKDLPVAWDETIVLDNSKIGKLAALAKRKDKTWYIVIINGEDKEKELNINLSFLSDKRYNAKIINDKRGSGDSFEITSIGLDRDKSPILRIEANGGVILRLDKN